MKKFIIPNYDHVDKDFCISGSNNPLNLSVDYDDVDHYVVDELLKVVVAHLNTIPKEIWNEALSRARDRRKEDGN